MSPNQDTATLRRELWEITDGADRAPVSEHAQRFSDLATRIPHTISVLPNPYGDGVPLRRFTCFMHVLGITLCPTYIEIASCYAEVFAGTDFMLSLLQEGVLREIAGNNPSDGDIIIYFGDGQPKHAGLIYQGRVRSKWGAYQFLEHNLWEVPISYGDQHRYFEPITTNVALEAFLHFAKSKLVSTMASTSS